MVTVFSSVLASIPAQPSSRPTPLVFIPPQGRRASGGPRPLTQTDPARTRAAMLYAWPMSRVQIYAPRP